MISRRHFAVSSAAFLLTGWSASAQEQPVEVPVPADLGFLRFVNAVAAPGKLVVRLDGTKLSREGFPEGTATGAVGFSAKTYQVEMEHEDLGKVTVPVPLQTGQITTLVAFKTEKPEKDPKTGRPVKADPAKKGPRLAYILDQAPVSPPDLTESKLVIIQVAPEEQIPFTVQGTAATATTEKPVTVPIKKSMGVFPEIHLEGKPVCLLNFKFPADQLVVFFRGQDGSLKYAQSRNDVM